jgi:EAL domain-containing protein (putative c-di-GMP-specific phosphodiesterase class I)
MGIRTIAERVDSADVLARLADIGIQYAQGHYIGEPQPVEILDTLLQADPADFRLSA